MHSESEFLLLLQCTTTICGLPCMWRISAASWQLQSPSWPYLLGRHIYVGDLILLAQHWDVRDHIDGRYVSCQDAYSAAWDMRLEPMKYVLLDVGMQGRPLGTLEMLLVRKPVHACIT